PSLTSLIPRLPPPKSPVRLTLNIQAGSQTTTLIHLNLGGGTKSPSKNIIYVEFVYLGSKAQQMASEWKFAAGRLQYRQRPGLCLRAGSLADSVSKVVLGDKADAISLKRRLVKFKAVSLFALACCQLRK
ncbi:hypothetical protein BaRGS_00014743, partial [Batillaria attramentaria]